MCLSSPGEVESVNALWGGTAAHGQVFPSTDANDATEEELEAESFTRGERGPNPRILISTWMKKIATVRAFHSSSSYITVMTRGPLGVFSLFLMSNVPDTMSTLKYLTASSSYR